MSKINLLFRTSAHVKKRLLCRIWILASLPNLHSCGVWRWCEKVGPETPGLHVQTRQEQDSAACPKIKPKAAPESKDFPLTNDREVTSKLEISVLNLCIPRVGWLLYNSDPEAKNPGFVLIIPASSWNRLLSGVRMNWIQSLNSFPKDLLEHIQGSSGKFSWPMKASRWTSVEHSKTLMDSDRILHSHPNSQSLLTATTEDIQGDTEATTSFPLWVHRSV